MITKTTSSQPAAARRIARTCRGSISLLVVVILAAVAVMALAVASISLTGTRITRSGQDKVTGLTLAEAGVDDTIATLSSDSSIVVNLMPAGTALQGSQITSKTITGTLYEDTANTTPEGSYTATLTCVDKSSGHMKVVSTGTNANNTTRTVVARITQGSTSLGNAAVLSNGPVSTGGNSDIETTRATSFTTSAPPASYDHNANIYSNGNISFGGAATVDGTLISAGTTNGTAYYPSVSNAPTYPFPSASATAALNQQWQSQAQKSGSASYNGSTLFPTNSSTVTITAPAYISGDLKMVGSQTLIIKGSSNGDMVYLNGNLSMSANSAIINGAAFVVGGTMSQNGQSTYSVDGSQFTSSNGAPTLAVYSGDITLNGGSANQLWGIIYAVNGGIKVNGNALFTGALVSGGANSTVTVTGTYNQYFPEGMASAISMPKTPVVTHIEEL